MESEETDLCLPRDGEMRLQQVRVRSDGNAQYCSSYLYHHSAARQTSLKMWLRSKRLGTNDAESDFEVDDLRLDRR